MATRSGIRGDRLSHHLDVSPKRAVRNSTNNSNEKAKLIDTSPSEAHKRRAANVGETSRFRSSMLAIAAGRHHAPTRAKRARPASGFFEDLDASDSDQESAVYKSESESSKSTSPEQLRLRRKLEHARTKRLYAEDDESSSEDEGLTATLTTASSRSSNAKQRASSTKKVGSARGRPRKGGQAMKSSPNGELKEDGNEEGESEKRGRPQKKAKRFNDEGEKINHLAPASLKRGRPKRGFYGHFDAESESSNEARSNKVDRVGLRRSAVLKDNSIDRASTISVYGSSDDAGMNGVVSTTKSPAKREQPSSSAVKPRTDEKSRYDQLGHWPLFDGASLPCQVCGVKTAVHCVKCGVHMCGQRGRNCFFSYHNKSEAPVSHTH